jgi:hypothetical protein
MQDLVASSNRACAYVDFNVAELDHGAVTLVGNNIEANVAVGVMVSRCGKSSRCTANP